MAISLLLEGHQNPRVALRHHVLAQVDQSEAPVRRKVLSPFIDLVLINRKKEDKPSLLSEILPSQVQQGFKYIVSFSELNLSLIVFFPLLHPLLAHLIIQLSFVGFFLLRQHQLALLLVLPQLLFPLLLPLLFLRQLLLQLTSLLRNTLRAIAEGLILLPSYLCLLLLY